MRTGLRPICRLLIGLACAIVPGRVGLADGDDRAIEWPARLTRARSGDASVRFEAAWWALDHGLTPEAEALLRESFAADPTHRPTARLVAALDRLAAPIADPDVDRLRGRLGVATEVERGPHVLLIHQHDQIEARARIDLIERVITTFYLGFAARGLDLPAPRSRLVAVWFARRSDYVAFLRASDAGAFLGTVGYYHPTEGAVLSYDYRSHPAQAASRASLAAMRRAERDRPELARLALQVEHRRLAIDLGTAAHETIHQLVMASGLAPRHDAFPLWLHEGLAAQYEVVRDGRWAGPGRVNDARLPDWKAIHPPPRLLPLLRDEGFGRGYQPGSYAQAWALVFYLRMERPTEFAAFLDLLRLPDRQASSPARTLAAFRAAFGDDPAAIEGAWHRYLSTLNPPVEAPDPSPPPPADPD